MDGKNLVERTVVVVELAGATPVGRRRASSGGVDSRFKEIEQGRKHFEFGERTSSQRLTGGKNLNIPIDNGSNQEIASGKVVH